MRRFMRLIASFLLLVTLASCSGEPEQDKPLETDEPITSGEIRWPKSDIAALIPQPKSNIGEIGWEASYGFVIYLDGMTQADYTEYVDSCYDAGFNVDYRRGDDYFYADNADGYSLALTMDDDGRVFIRMDEPDEDESGKPSVEPTAEPSVEPSVGPSAEPSVEPTTGPTEEPDSGIRPEVKAAIDAYEAFIDEYVEFMAEYAESGSSLTMLTEYLDMLQRYTEEVDKFSELESGLTTEESRYYLEVSMRCLEKITSSVSDN